TMWGKHLIIDMSAGDRDRVQSAQHISRFVETLVETIGMKGMGRRCSSISPNIRQRRPDIPSCN
ncbi:MAG: hypothetical protein WBB72_08245, partial [Methyloceanibacter sp.]